ncbi:MAG TPA: PAS domain S-box protein [Thermoanaerobaculia bacterium]|nr:PAS domain S-box protein [Thermoanaerobaculia bacterium]
MTPALDVPTLLVAVGSIYLGLTVAMAMVWRQTPTMPGLGHFALAHALTVAGATLAALRGVAPQLLTLVLGQGLLVAGCAVLFEGDRAFFGLPDRHRVSIPVAAATVAALAYYVYAEPSGRARTLVFSGALGVLFAWDAWIAARRGKALGDGPPALMRACALGGVGAALALRLAITAAGLRPGSDWPASALILCVGLAGIAGGVAVLMVVSRRLLAAAERAGRALAASEERYRGLFEQSLGLICTHALDGTILTVNAAAAATLGYPVERMVGRSLREFLAPAFRGRLGDYLKAIAADGEKCGTMILLDSAGGERVWQYRNHLVSEPDRPAYVLGHALDVTERTIRLNVMSSAVEHAGDPILITDPGGRIEYVNPAFERLSGHPAKSILGKTPRVLKSGLHPAEFYRDMWETILAGETFRAEVANRHADGEIYWVEQAIAPIRDKSGHVTHFVSSSREVTQQRKLKQDLERAAAEWLVTFDTIEEPIVVANVEGRVLRLNRAAARLAGGSYAGAVGAAVAALGAGEPWQGLSQLARQVVETGGAGSRRAVEQRSGREWDLSASASASGGIAARVVLCARDVSRQQELERSLRRSETLSVMGSLVAGVAHAVRNPLFGISAIMDALSADFREHAELASYLSMLRGPVSRLSDLMRELLDFGKPSTLAQTTSGLAEVVERGIDAMRNVAGDTRVRVRSAGLESLPAVLLDPVRMERALESLIENAIQHAPPGSEVVVEGRATAAGAAEIQVLDKGPGFPPDVIDHVFEPFFTRRHGGTGLGLAIAHRIVEDHGGSVAVGNRTAGGGWVRVLLPAGGPAASGASRT